MNQIRALNGYKNPTVSKADFKAYFGPKIVLLLVYKSVEIIVNSIKCLYISSLDQNTH